MGQRAQPQDLGLATGMGTVQLPDTLSPQIKDSLPPSSLAQPPPPAQARPFVPTRCHGDGDSKTWHFKASLLSWRAGRG